MSYGLLNANDYGVPQDRLRVIIVGYLSCYDKFFEPPKPKTLKPVLKDAIWDLRSNVLPAVGKNKANPKVKIPNHEYMTGVLPSHDHSFRLLGFLLDLYY